MSAFATIQLTKRLPMLPDDYAALLALQRQSWEINFASYPFNERTFRLSLEAGCRHREIAVYDAQDGLVGFLWLDTRTSAGPAHIRHIQVAKLWWGRGIGRRLVADAVAECRRQGRDALTLNVTKSNERAMRMYEHLGFLAIEDYGNRQRMRLSL